jgi:methyl-accepting chemotaxis protein
MSNPLDQVGDILGGLKDKAQDAVENIMEGAENLAEGIVGEENVKKATDFLNQDVGDVASNLKNQAEDLLDKKPGKDA